MIIKCTGETGRDAYRRNRASWNNEAIGGIRERRDHGNRECGLSNAEPLRPTSLITRSLSRSFDAGEFPTSSDKGIVSLNCKSGVSIYFRPSCFAKLLSFLKKKNYGGRCIDSEHL